MSAPASVNARRFSVKLDPTCLAERLMLRRLDHLPAARGREWLRALLTLGFLSEGRWLRLVEPSAPDAERPALPIPPYAGWDRPQRGNAPRGASSAGAVLAANPSGEYSKPFAALGRVLG